MRPPPAAAMGGGSGAEKRSRTLVDQDRARRRSGLAAASIEPIPKPLLKSDSARSAALRLSAARAAHTVDTWLKHGWTMATAKRVGLYLRVSTAGRDQTVENQWQALTAAMERKGWQIVEKNQNKISTMVMDMLSFSKEREPELAPADLSEVVADVVELLEPRAKELNVALTWTPDDSLPTIQFDSEAIHRAVLNVGTNAIDACEGRANGKVEVSTKYLADRSLAASRDPWHHLSLRHRTRRQSASLCAP